MRAASAGVAVFVVSAALISTGDAGPATAAVPSPIAGGWRLNGNARLLTTATPEALQLTAATNSQAGSAFWPTSVPGAGVKAVFDAFLGRGTGGTGLTFTLADASVSLPTALGANGGGEGFAGITGVALSLDTTKNTGDPASNFVGIATTSARKQVLHYATTNSSITSLRNKWHHFVVTTTATRITATMDGTQVLAAPTSVPARVLVGFTGATGAANDLHQVRNVAITTATPPPTPTVTKVSPSSGPTTGTTSVTITGTGFTGATGVRFGATAASTFTVKSATSIATTAPPGAGTVDVTVTTPGGTSAVNASDAYTYNAISTIPSPVSGGWQLNGSSQLVTSASPPNLQLTSATNWVAGSAFWPLPVPGAGITASFDAFIGPGSGADGLTFALADANVAKPTALGVNAGGEGFAG
ncbi:MAG TPA: IPT/TIG domain-containing protein, partial [Acidimicrobiia bacterium]